jgi:hypothetical protein
MKIAFGMTNILRGRIASPPLIRVSLPELYPKNSFYFRAILK